jgi:uncharacterized membrane protein YfbV (UPF0208 family)
MEKKNAPVFADLRNKIFTINPEKFSIPATPGNAVFGVVMDMGFAEGWATLVVLADGNASLYLSSGGGVIGGIGNEAVREAAIAMTNVADQYVDQTATTEGTPLPPPGEEAFYILTTQGIRAATAKEDDLVELRHPLSTLFYAGQEVITQLRLQSETPQKAC